jgi:death-on-curing protein
MKYLTAKEVLYIQSRVVKDTGGAAGLRDPEALQLAIERPQQTLGTEDLFPDVFFKTAALMESIIDSKPFVDGNLRVAIVAAIQMLHENHYRLLATNPDLATFVMTLVRRKPPLPEIAAWLETNTKR